MKKRVMIGFGSSLVYSITNWDTDNQFHYWEMYPLIGFVVFTIAAEIHFLNKALGSFSTAIVTPVYYVIFTSASILTSAILFRGFVVESVAGGITLILGFFVIVAGVALLFQYSIKLNKVAQALIAKRKKLESNDEAANEMPIEDDDDDDYLDDEDDDDMDDEGLGGDGKRVSVPGLPLGSRPKSRAASSNFSVLQKASRGLNKIFGGTVAKERMGELSIENEIEEERYGDTRFPPENPTRTREFDEGPSNMDGPESEANSRNASVNAAGGMRFYPSRPRTAESGRSTISGTPVQPMATVGFSNHPSMQYTKFASTAPSLMIPAAISPNATRPNSTTLISANYSTRGLSSNYANAAASTEFGNQGVNYIPPPRLPPISSTTSPEPHDRYSPSSSLSGNEGAHGGTTHGRRIGSANGNRYPQNQRQQQQQQQQQQAPLRSLQPPNYNYPSLPSSRPTTQQSQISNNQFQPPPTSHQRYHHHHQQQQQHYQPYQQQQRYLSSPTESDRGMLYPAPSPTVSTRPSSPSGYIPPSTGSSYQQQQQHQPHQQQQQQQPLFYPSGNQYLKSAKSKNQHVQIIPPHPQHQQHQQSFYAERNISGDAIRMNAARGGLAGGPVSSSFSSAAAAHAVVEDAFDDYQGGGISPNESERGLMTPHGRGRSPSAERKM
jgi:hypothetical protein